MFPQNTPKPLGILAVPVPVALYPHPTRTRKISTRPGRYPRVPDRVRDTRTALSMYIINRTVTVYQTLQGRIKPTAAVVVKRSPSTN